MRLPRKFTADAAAGLLLIGAAVVLVATPYDGGSCTNVVAAYAVPTASVSAEDRPDKPRALADAQRAVTTANAALAELETERFEVEELQAAAQAAREAAAEAQSDLWAMPYSDYSSDSYSAEWDVDIAESAVESAESWLEYVQESAADTSGWSIYTQDDVADAQADLDEALADLSEAESALAQAESEDAARESEAENAEATAEQLDADADAAEQAAVDAATDLADRQSSAEERLYSAQERVSQLQAQHDRAIAEWFHEERVAEDEATASNNVRASCRENGAWRAGVALLDVALAGALVIRRWMPRLSRLPWRTR